MSMNPENMEFKAAESLENQDAVLESASLEPKLMEVPGMGEVLVGGDPYGIADRLDDHQGDNVLNLLGDCGLVSVTNIAIQAGLDVTEDDLAITAVRNGLCVVQNDNDPTHNGSTDVYDRQALLGILGISTTVHAPWAGNALSPEEIAEFVEAGHGVNISVNAGYAWNDANYIQDGNTNHSIMVTGTVRDPETGDLKGLIVCDSGVPGRSNATVLTMDTLNDAYVRANGASALVTDRPIAA